MGCGCSAPEENELCREEDDVEGRVNYKVGDPRFIELQKWPVLLMDTTGSMTHACSRNSDLPRQNLVFQSAWHLVSRIAPYDDAEEKYVYEQGIGLPCVTFNGIEGGKFRGLLHPNNIVNEFNQIRFHGATHIMDGWKAMLDRYEMQFQDRPQSNRPLLLCLLITDGEIQDAEEFERHLKRVRGRVFVEIAVVGFGEDHDNAIRHYRRIARTHDHVRVTEFTDKTDPDAIARQLLSLVNPALLNSAPVKPVPLQGQSNASGMGPQNSGMWMAQAQGMGAQQAYGNVPPMAQQGMFQQPMYVAPQGQQQVMPAGYGQGYAAPPAYGPPGNALPSAPYAPQTDSAMPPPSYQ